MSLHASFNRLHIQQQRRRWRLLRLIPVMLIFLLVFDGFRLTISSSSSSSSSSSVDDNSQAKQEDQNHQVIIQDAINKSRYHLENFTPEDSPYAFPNTRYRLAVMLESQLQPQKHTKQDQTTSTTYKEQEDEEEDDVWKECSRLYKEAAFNTTSPLDTTFKRISSLYRSAEIILDNIIIEEEEPSLVEEAESLLWYSLDVVSNCDGDGHDEEEEDLAPLYATVFEKLVRRLLSKAATASSQKVGNDNDNDNDNKSSSSYLEDALRVCDKCSELCPFEPVVDEYRGAILRQYHGTGRRRSSRRNTNTAFILDRNSPLLSSSSSSSSSSQSSFGLHNNVAASGDDDAAKEVYDAYESAVHKSNQVAMEVLIQYLPSFNKNKQNNVVYEYGSIPKKLLLESKSSKSDLRSSLLQVDEEKSIYIIDIWSRLIRHIILVACSAREAGLSKIEENHWRYGLEVLSFVNNNNNDDDDEPLIQIPKVIQADFFTNVGIHYKKLSKSKKAIEYFQKALEVNPDDGHAIVQLASLEEDGGKGGQVDNVVHLDDSYVAGLFDGYSQRFEQELVEDLNYIGHKLVADALFAQSNWIDHNSSSETTTTIKVIDIGCGTGLLGELLRIRLHDIIIKKESSEQQETCSNTVPSSSERKNTAALSIAGVDLSPRMVDLSRARMIKIFDKDDDADQVAGVFPVYDNVVVSDAVTYLQSIESNDISAITASDVFIYVGALEGIFQECSRVLHIGGLLVFTIESPPPDSSSHGGVKLLKSGRFGHTRKHIKQVANEFGFQLEKWEDAVLRTQGGIDVPGAVVVLSKKQTRENNKSL